MSGLHFEFDQDKTTEAIIYLAQRAAEPTRMAVAKLLYFADRKSLEDYGRFITGETYYAMMHGPVPTNAYDMIKRAADVDDYGFRSLDDHTIHPLRDPQLNQLSESDLDTLDAIIGEYGHFSASKLRALSHDETWEKVWSHCSSTTSVPIPLEEIVRSINGGDELLEYLMDTLKPSRPNDEVA